MSRKKEKITITRADIAEISAEDPLGKASLPERIRHVMADDYDEGRHAEGRCQSGKVYNVIRTADKSADSSVLNIDSLGMPLSFLICSIM